MLDSLVAAEPRVRRREGVIRSGFVALLTPTDRARSLPGLPFPVDTEGPQRGEPRVDLVVQVGDVLGPQALAAGGAQPGTIGLAQWGDRLAEGDGLGGKRAEVELVVVGQPGDVGLRAGSRCRAGIASTGRRSRSTVSRRRTRRGSCE